MRMTIDKFADRGSVIPAVRSRDDFLHAVHHTTAPSVILLFGDINDLPWLVRQGLDNRKRLILQIELFEGLGKDRPGMQFLAQAGVTALITSEPRLGKHAREEGLFVIQRLCLTDSVSLRAGAGLLRNFRPDAVEILPALTPAAVIRELTEEFALPVLGGGLLRSPDDVACAVSRGVWAVSASRRELWS
jgi:glycerol uptake operon antiterminator